MDRERLSFGVLGAGGIARRKTMPGMLAAANCRLAAVMDPVSVDEIAAEFGVAGAYATESELLNDPAVEAVYIASPVHCHAKQIAMAAEAGKPILCEKPLTRTLDEAREAVAVCRKHGVPLQEGYMMKFHGAHTRIKQIIDEGRLGTIVSMRAQLSCWYPPIEGAWRQDPSTGGGGAMLDMATHLFDLLEHFAGPVRRVVSFTGNQVQGYASEDSSTTMLEFVSGAQATVDSFFCIPDEASRTRLEVYGSQGAILSEGTIGQGSGGRLEGIFGRGDAGYEAQQNKDSGQDFQTLPFEPVNPYTAECESFAASVLAGREPELNGPQHAIHIMSLVQAAYESARTGRVLEVADAC